MSGEADEAGDPGEQDEPEEDEPFGEGAAGRAGGESAVKLVTSGGVSAFRSSAAGAEDGMLLACIEHNLARRAPGVGLLGVIESIPEDAEAVLKRAEPT